VIRSRPLLRLSPGTRLVAAVAAASLLVAACGGGGRATPGPDDDRASIVVTYAVLGAVAQELVGDTARVTVLTGNGVDPHDWSPSARDIETVEQADLVVANGLGLEEGLIRVFEEAEDRGVPVFRATDHITIRELDDEDHDEDEAGDEHEDGDPHFWVDPVSMKAVVTALGAVLSTDLGLDVSERQAELEASLDALDAEVRDILGAVPPSDRKLVTGHESMGYFADRYDFVLVGAVIPGLTSQGEVSAGELARLKTKIEEEQVRAIFAEIGTPAAVVEAIGREAGVAVVQLPSHTLPEDGSYLTFIRDIATTIADALT
jgi:zinc/manganese transport system substrate-binding protein